MKSCRTVKGGMPSSVCTTCQEIYITFIACIVKHETEGRTVDPILGEWEKGYQGKMHYILIHMD